MVTVSPETSTPTSSLILPRSITSEGEASRCFITGIRVWPPERYLASLPLPNRLAASSTEGGGWEVVSYMASPPLTVDRMPDAIGRRRHFQLVVADGVRDRVDHGSRGTDRAGL